MKRARQSESSASASQTRAPQSADGLSAEERVWQVVAAIPRGRVVTYGQIAHLAGMPSHARLVGRVLGNLPDGTRLPWHRVVNAGLKISLRGDDRAMLEQRRRLEREGVSFIGTRIARHHLWLDHPAPTA